MCKSGVPIQIGTEQLQNKRITDIHLLSLLYVLYYYQVQFYN